MAKKSLNTGEPKEPVDFRAGVEIAHHIRMAAAPLGGCDALRSAHNDCGKGPVDASALLTPAGKHKM